MGARVINASWAMLYNGNIAAAIQDAANSGIGGIPVVLSVFNNSDTDECAAGADQTFASLPEVIAVGASNDKDLRVPAGTGSCLALLAPGGTAPDRWGITTTDQRGDYGYNLREVPTGQCGVAELADRDYTACFSGTSAAAPIVSGTIGLMLSVNPSLDRSEVKTILEETAEKIEPATAGYDASGLSLTHGHGRLNAAKAVQEAKSGTGPSWCALIILVAAVLVLCVLLWRCWERILAILRRKRLPRAPGPPPPIAD
jgi:subtilisin family serine protease